MAHDQISEVWVLESTYVAALIDPQTGDRVDRTFLEGIFQTTAQAQAYVVESLGHPLGPWQEVAPGYLIAAGTQGSPVSVTCRYWHVPSDWLMRPQPPKES